MSSALLTWLVLVLTGLVLLGLLAFGLTVRAVRRIEAMLPPQGRFLDLPQARLHVLERGQAADPEQPVLVLIHGLAGQLGHFSYRLVDELASTHRVIAIDRPGSGYSTWQADIEPTLDAQAAVIGALIDRLALHRVLLVGHSLGGAVALATAIHHGSRVVGLALLAPLTQRPEGVPRVFRGLMVGTDGLCQWLAWTLVLPIARLQRERLLRPIFAPDPVPPDYGLRAGGELSLRPGHFIAAARDLAALPASIESLVSRYPALRAGPAMPVGVLFGRQDRILAASLHGEAFARDQPGVRLELIDAGHMLPIVQPSVCADFIRRVAMPEGPFTAGVAPSHCDEPHRFSRTEQPSLTTNP